MDILIACHCKAQHKPVYITDSLNNPTTTNNASSKYISLYDTSPENVKKLKELFNIAKIDYIDKRCNEDVGIQYASWDKLLESGYDMVYLVHCPIYSLFNGYNDIGVKHMKVFFEAIRKSLKPHGKVYIEFNKHNKSTRFNSGTIKSRTLKNFNSNIFIRKVFQDILTFEDPDINYKLEILEKVKLNKSGIAHVLSTNDIGHIHHKKNKRIVLLSFPESRKVTGKAKIKHTQKRIL
jgi:hypothetical protein